MENYILNHFFYIAFQTVQPPHFPPHTHKTYTTHHHCPIPQHTHKTHLIHILTSNMNNLCSNIDIGVGYCGT